jgi:hypothetical protein
MSERPSGYETGISTKAQGPQMRRSPNLSNIMPRRWRLMTSTKRLLLNTLGGQQHG